MKQDTSVRLIHRDLPIFRIDRADRSLIYTPGKFVSVDAEEADLLQGAWENPAGPIRAPFIHEVSGWIEGHARDAAQARLLWLKEPFMPECLTVYLSNYCNLECLYCFAADRGDRTEARGAKELPVVNKTVVSAAARLVAKNCAAKGKKFVLVLHGGGEPTIHWGLVKGIVNLSRVIAQEYGIPWFGYIATNGIMPENRALWLGQHFDVVGLSCDGPPEIQDRQRCLHKGGKSSLFVGRTSRMIQDAGGHVEVRSTITPETIERQAEIVSYIYHKLGASTVRLEPAYCGRNRSEHRFTKGDADRFVTHFLEAQDLATSLGCTLSFSGVRTDEIHGPYCDVLRNVLRLTPDGVATACFFSTGSHDPTGRQLQIGGLDASTGEFVLDMDRIDSFRRKAGAIPGTCSECINSYSCTRACPDFCSALHHGWQNMTPHNNQRKEAAEFRCLVHQKMTLARILKSTKQHVDGAVPVGWVEGDKAGQT